MLESEPAVFSSPHEPSFGGAAAAANSAEGAGPEPSHIPVSRLQIGSWNLQSKHNEHILVTFYYTRRKMIWEILHVGVVRKMEADFDDIRDIVLAPAPGDAAKMTVELSRPPRFYKEQAPSSGASKGNFIFTSDFTNGQASQVSRHVILFAPGVVSKHVGALREAGLPLRLDQQLLVDEDGAFAEGGMGREYSGLQHELSQEMGPAMGRHPAISALRTPPTSSPRLDAITLQEQLDREMRDRQARYVGICPIREEIYAKVFDELIAAINTDCSKRGLLQRRVRDEARMSIDAYRTVYESSIKFGSRKLSQAVTLKGDLEQTMADLEGEITRLKEEVKEQRELCESLEFRASETEKKYATKDPEIEALEAQEEQLKALKAALEPSKESKS